MYSDLRENSSLSSIKIINRRSGESNLLITFKPNAHHALNSPIIQILKNLGQSLENLSKQQITLEYYSSSTAEKSKALQVICTAISIDEKTKFNLFMDAKLFVPKDEMYQSIISFAISDFEKAKTKAVLAIVEKNSNMLLINYITQLVDMMI